MRVLYITDVFPPHCGGSGWSVYFFARGLRERGHEVHILALDGHRREYDGFKIDALSVNRSPVPFLANWKRESQDLPAIAQSIRAVAADYDVVHAHHKLSSLAVLKAKPPNFFLTIRDYWPVCICGRSTYRTRFLCTRGDFFRCSFHDGWWKGIAAPVAYSWFEPRLKERLREMQSARRIFCISHYIREQLLPFFEPEKLDVLPNFAEPIASDEATDLPAHFVLYVGRLEENKGAQLLPTLMEESDVDLPLIVVGEGSLREKLEAETASRGVVAQFLGYREYPQMLAILARCDFVLFPSQWAEPLGRVLIESAMMGKAAIAFAHPGGHRDILEHEKTGLLEENAAGFAKAIQRLDSDASLREQLGRNARAKYERLFNPDVVLPRLLEIYQR